MLMLLMDDTLSFSCDCSVVCDVVVCVCVGLFSLGRLQGIDGVRKGQILLLSFTKVSIPRLLSTPCNQLFNVSSAGEGRSV